MARKNRRSPEEPRPLAAAGSSRVDSTGRGDYLVRTIPAARAVKSYRCPYCQQEIQPGTAHIVSWPRESGTGLDSAGDRRHWHTACWSRQVR